MKKIIFTLVAILCLTISCKQTKETKPIENETKTINATVANDSLEKIISLLDKMYCESADFKASESIHKISMTQFDSMISTYSTAPKNISWQAIYSQFPENDCYSKYVAFKCDSTTADNEKIEIEMIDKFTLKRPCYSIPLFKGVALKNNLKDSDEFSFYKAKNGKGLFTVIFAGVRWRRGCGFPDRQWPSPFRRRSDTRSASPHTAQRG